MAIVRVEASAGIRADPETVYGVIADYRDGHPRILPPRYFSGLEVERGGRGAGTIIRFGMTVLGRERWSRAEVAEPEPGRVLTETVLEDERGLVTTFTVDPAGEGRSQVTIRTAWTVGGLPGLAERLLAPPLLRRIYRDELARLAEVASSRLAAPRDPP